MLPDMPSFLQVLPALLACAVFRVALTCVAASRSEAATPRARRTALALAGLSLAVTLGALLVTARPGGASVWIALGCVAWCILMAEDILNARRDP